MSDHENERRKQRAFERFGTDHPICAHCGNENWWQLERHHIAGRRSDEACVILCSNDHATMTLAQHDHPPRREPADPLLDQIGRFLLGLADLLKIAVEKLAEFGRQLIERARVAAPPGDPA